MAEKSERSLCRGSPIPEQQQRLAELMRRWWKARDSGTCCRRTSKPNLRRSRGPLCVPRPPPNPVGEGGGRD